MKHRQPTFWLCALVLAALIGAAGTFQARGFHPGTNVASNTAPIVGIAVENGHGLHNAHPATQVEFNTGIAVTNTSDNCVTTCVRNVRMNGNAIPLRLNRGRPASPPTPPRARGLSSASTTCSMRPTRLLPRALPPTRTTTRPVRYTYHRTSVHRSRRRLPSSLLV